MQGVIFLFFWTFACLVVSWPAYTPDFGKCNAWAQGEGSIDSDEIGGVQRKKGPIDSDEIGGVHRKKGPIDSDEIGGVHRNQNEISNDPPGLDRLPEILKKREKQPSVFEQFGK